MASEGYQALKGCKLRNVIFQTNKLIHLNTTGPLPSTMWNTCSLFHLPSSNHNHENRRAGRNRRQEKLTGPLPVRHPITRLPQSLHSHQPIHLSTSLNFLMPTHHPLSSSCSLNFPCLHSCSLFTIPHLQISQEIYRLTIKTILAQEDGGMWRHSSK